MNESNKYNMKPEHKQKKQKDCLDDVRRGRTRSKIKSHITKPREVTPTKRYKNKVKSHTKSKSKHTIPESKRETTKTTISKKLIVKPKVTCVIHINGEYLQEEKRKCKRKKRNKTKETSSSTSTKPQHISRVERVSIERIQPLCNRTKCQEICAMKQKKKHLKSSQKAKRCNRKRNKEKLTERKQKSKINEINPIPIEDLSPISTEESSNGLISYEDVSSDELSEKRKDETKNDNVTLTKIETVTSPNEKYENPLEDTRTRSPYNLISNSSTPFSDPDNVTVFSSEMDVSIHSLPTVVLSPKIDTELYSPTNSVEQEYWYQNDEISDFNPNVEISDFNHNVYNADGDIKLSSTPKQVKEENIAELFDDIKIEIITTPSP